MPRLPDDCSNMADVREGVDATDRQLIALLGLRFGYMRAAARIKPERDQVRDEVRRTAVIEAAVAAAVEAGLPVAAVAELWERLVEASIVYEMAEWDRLRG